MGFCKRGHRLVLCIGWCIECLVGFFANGGVQTVYLCEGLITCKFEGGVTGVFFKSAQYTYIVSLDSTYASLGPPPPKKKMETNMKNVIRLLPYLTCC